jgi:MFS family permease
MIEQTGWRTACTAMGILILVVLAPINLLLRLRPEDIGLRPDGDGVPKAGAPAPVSNVVDPAWAAVDWTLARAAATARFWWIALGYFCSLYSWYAIQVHQTKYLVEIGFTPSVAAWALGLVSLVGIPGQIALGHLSDRIGREWVWLIGNLGFVACYLILVALQHNSSPFLLYAMVAAQGLVGYGLTPVFGPIVMEIFQGKHYGTIFGTLMLSAIAGGAAGPWVSGLLYDRLGSYDLAFWLGAGASMVAIVTIWLAAPRHVRAVAGRTARIPPQKA